MRTASLVQLVLCTRSSPARLVVKASDKRHGDLLTCRGVEGAKVSVFAREQAGRGTRLHVHARRIVKHYSIGDVLLVRCI